MNEKIANKVVSFLSVEKESISAIKISFYIQTTLSELEKMVIIIVLYALLGFLNDIVIILSVMLMLRPYIGGTHKETFVSCLITTAIFSAIPIYMAEYIKLSSDMRMIATIILLFLVWGIGPVTSKYRPKYEGEVLRKIKLKGTIMLLVMNSIVVLFNEKFKNEITILLCMLALDMILAKGNQIIERRKEDI